ncbi:MAG: hypothetical protein DCC67_13285 [Planctomycetota bacterium]|nr:MAG: hypothetical protein DCC67_13285 [Planctomycetota bacterium]
MSNTIETPESHATASPPRQNSTLTVLGLIVIAAAVLYLLATRERRDATPDAALSHPAVGAPLADFDVAVLTGEGENVLAGDLKGKVALVSFWGPWCGPCKTEFPHLAKLAENLRARDDFRWLPVTYDQSLAGSPQQLRQDASAFLSQAGLKTVTYHDPNESLLGAASAAGAFDGAFPCTILVDKSGHIHAVWKGFRPGVEKQVEAAVLELLDEKAG